MIIHRCSKLARWPRYVFLDSLRDKRREYKVQWDKKTKEYLFIVTKEAV